MRKPGRLLGFPSELELELIQTQISQHRSQCCGQKCTRMRWGFPQPTLYSTGLMAAESREWVNTQKTRGFLGYWLTSNNEMRLPGKNYCFDTAGNSNPPSSSSSRAKTKSLARNCPTSSSSSSPSKACKERSQVHGSQVVPSTKYFLFLDCSMK